MNTLLLSTLLLASGAIAAAVVRSSDRSACWLGAGSAVLSIAILFSYVLFSPGGTFSGSEKLFLLPIAFVGFSSALYAPSYMMKHSKGECGRFFFFFNATLGSMLMVVFMRKMIPFLAAWELMGLFSFFLVITDRQSEKSRLAGWIYLLACEAGGLLLMLACVLHYKGLVHAYPMLYFILLTLGFGLKAGFILLHVWLPQAHPAAPAPVSALMSGSMIVLGFCGLFRFLPQTNYFHELCGNFLLFAGLAGAFCGILGGMVQKDLKSLLAYSSVENVGIISMGFGLGFLGLVNSVPAMAYCGFAGAALHILNHALLKGALFLGAGTVLAATHTLNMDQLGGLMKRLPKTGMLFTFASVGICGLPPFCAFAGELLIYAGAFNGIIAGKGPLMVPSMLAAIVLALTGAVACAAFVKAVSGVFLGEPRTDHAKEAAQEHAGFYLPVFFLCAIAFVMPFAAPCVLHWISSKIMDPFTRTILEKNAFFTLGILILTGILGALRALRKNSTRQVGTWDCGYARPDARMEYTATAFVQPLADLFQGLLRGKKDLEKPKGTFLQKASLEVDYPDAGERFFWRKLFSWFSAFTGKIHVFQSGYLHLYILVMVLTLILMLCFGFWDNDLFTGGK